MRILNILIATSLGLAAPFAGALVPSALPESPTVVESLDYLRTHRASVSPDGRMYARLRRALWTIGGAVLLFPATQIDTTGRLYRAAVPLDHVVDLTRGVAKLTRLGLEMTAAISLLQATPHGLTVLTHWDDFQERRRFEAFMNEPRVQQLARLRADPELARAVVAIAQTLAQASPAPRADVTPLFDAGPARSTKNRAP